MAMSDPSERPPLRGKSPDPLPLPTSRPNAALRRCWRAPCPSTSDAPRTSQLLHQRVKPFLIARKSSSRQLGQSVSHGNSVRTECWRPRTSYSPLLTWRGGDGQEPRTRGPADRPDPRPGSAAHPHHGSINHARKQDRALECLDYISTSTIPLAQAVGGAGDSASTGSPSPCVQRVVKRLPTTVAGLHVVAFARPERGQVLR